MPQPALVHIPASLRRLTEGHSDLEATGSTVREVVDDLVVRYPNLRDRLIEQNRLKPGLSVAVNSVVCASGLKAAVPEGARVQFIPAIGGG